ncbi:MAG: zinc ribbon domain-containing protein [Candidatus Omnitrophica bacterium]|nr:zinc ribbon domain-containing protein [Candidatus Omnitrophota bacterium]
MPIYTYICKDCGEKFDLLVGITSQKVALKCKKCGSKKIKKTFAAFSMGESRGNAGSSGGTCPTGTCNL